MWKQPMCKLLLDSITVQMTMNLFYVLMILISAAMIVTTHVKMQGTITALMKMIYGIGENAIMVVQEKAVLAQYAATASAKAMKQWHHAPKIVVLI